MPQHKTRKQLRQEGETARAALAAIETPEGVARLIHDAQKRDQAFKDAVSFELNRLAEAELEETAEELEQALQEVADAAGEEAEGDPSEPGEEEPAAPTYRVRHVSGSVLANSLTATPSGDELASLAAAQGVLVSDLSIEPE